MENNKLNKMSSDMKQKQIEAIKQVVQQTFEQIDIWEGRKNEAQDKLRILKHDLFDLKDGRLDRVVERQGMDEKIKEISILSVVKTGAGGSTNPWYVEYEITFQYNGEQEKVVINNSTAKMYASGSYKLKSGMIKYL